MCAFMRRDQAVLPDRTIMVQHRSVSRAVWHIIASDFKKNQDPCAFMVSPFGGYL